VHTRGEVISHLEKIFGHSKLSNNGLNAAFLCPVCHETSGEQTKKKLVIRTDCFWAHCWVCLYKSRSVLGLIKKYHPDNLHEFMTEFADMLPSQEEEGHSKPFSATFNDLLEKEENLHENISVSLPKGFVPLVGTKNKSVQMQEARDYLFNRGLEIEDLWYYRFGVATQDAEYTDRVIIPSYGTDGILNFFTSRAIKKKIKPKYYGPKFPRETVVFNEINIDWTKEVLLVEGPFDLVKCGPNTVPLLGSDLTKDYLLFQRIIENNTPVLLGLDNDAKEKTYNITKLLLSYDIEIRHLDIPNEYNDLGQLTKAQVKQLCETAKPITTKDLFLYRLNQC